MICFEVYRNGEKLCTAGVTAGVLDAILSWVGGRKHEEEAARRGTVHQELSLHVGGLEAEGNEAGEHLRWRDEPLQLGDSILIRIIETQAADTPVSREHQDPALDEKRERNYYEYLRGKYGDGPR